MPKLPLQSSLAAIALCLAAPVLAQGQGGLGGKLDAAEQKLAQDSQSCTPINLGEYQSLLNEAAKNKKRAEKAKKTGAPVDDAQVNADLAKASALFNRALAAHVQQCVRQATAQAAQPPNQAMNLNPFEKTMLAIHNATRAKYGAAPLEWAPGMVVGAAAWAGTMARTGRFEHSPREDRGTQRENLAQAPLSYSDAQIIDGWVSEQADFVPGTFPNVCRSGGVCEGVLHLAQMIWPTTIRIGCGKAIGKGRQYVVCRYDPGGNKDGKLVGIPQTTNVADAGSKIEQPKLLPTEVFNPNSAPVKMTQQSQKPPAGPLLYDDEVIYGGLIEADVLTGRYDAHIFTPPGQPINDTINYGASGVTPDDEYWGASAGIIAKLSDDLSAEVGGRYEDFDFAEDPLGGGIYWDPVSYVESPQAEPGVETKVEQPNLSGKPEVFNPNGGKGASANNEEDRTNEVEPDAVAEEGEDEADQGLALTETAENEAFDPCKVPIAKSSSMIPEELYGLTQQAEFVAKKGDLESLRSYARLAREIAEGVKAGEIKGLDPDYAFQVAEQIEAILDAAGGPGPTNVEQPGLPPKEVYNPADAPKCVLDVM